MIGSRSAYTRKRILDAAARLFAQKGSNTSLREITAEARVNLSSVNYHFGSKEGLIQAIYQQQLDSLNHEQLAILDRLEAQARRTGTIDPGQIVEAFFRPLLRHAVGESSFSSLREHFRSDPSALIRTLSRNGHSAVLERFRAALAKALPDMPELELLWRFQFMLSAVYCTVSDMDGLLLALNSSKTEPSDTTQLIQRLLPFLVGGLLAPLPEAAHAGADTRAGDANWPAGRDLGRPRSMQPQQPE